MVSSKNKIVLLDDSENHLVTYGDALSDRYEVVRILLGRKQDRTIIGEIARLDPPPDAVLLDVFRNRPDGTGSRDTFLPLLSGLRERFGGRIPVIALSGRPRDTNVDLVLSWYRHGIQDWIWKDPIRVLDVARRVEESISLAKVLRATDHRPPRVAVAHGGNQPEDLKSLDKVKQMLVAAGTIPVVAEDWPSLGRSVNRHVLETFEGVDCAIVLATKDRSGKDPTKTRANIIHEIGVFQKELGNRLIILLENGCTLPSNVSELIREHFTPDNMEAAYIKIVKELRGFGLIGM